MNIKFLTAMAILFLITGCGQEASLDTKKAGERKMPEVNAENCKTENIAKLPEDIVDEFSSLCVRQSDAKESEPKEW